MTNQIAIVRADTRIQHRAINDPFSRYKPESEKCIKQFKIKENEIVKQMKEVFRTVKSFDLHRPKDYIRMLKLVKNIRVSSQDITLFSIAISEFQLDPNCHHNMGQFLSVLINNCRKKEFTISTKHFGIPIDALSFKAKKRITIQGDVRTLAGYGMQRGSITINGNAENNLGMFAVGSSITVNGNAGDWVGWNMKNSTITVKGNAGERIGRFMRSGTIFLEGEYTSLSDEIKGGNIFHKGKQIVKNGKRLI